MQKNKYLDDLGIPIEKYGTNFCDDNDLRSEDWKKEREEYGFDARECWNLDCTFIEWLYTHLMKYKEDAKIVDLTYHRFEFEGNEYSLEEAIHYILNKLRDALLENQYDRDDVAKAIRMWAEIYSACWW